MKKKASFTSQFLYRSVKKIDNVLIKEKKFNYERINTIISVISLVATIFGFYFIYTSLQVQIIATNAQIESLKEQKKATNDQIRATETQIKAINIQSLGLNEQKKSTIAQTNAIEEQIKSNEAQNTSNLYQYEQLRLQFEQDRRNLQPIFTIKDLNNLPASQRIEALELTLINNKALNVLLKPIKNDALDFQMMSSLGDREANEKIKLTYKSKTKFNYLRDKSGYFVISQRILDIIFMDIGERIYKQSVYTNGVYFSISRSELSPKSADDYRKFMIENPIHTESIN